MNKILLDQLQTLSTVPFKIDNGDGKDFSKPFSEVIFYKNASEKNLVRVRFADYFLHPFQGFDFHHNWNNDNPPPCEIMYGEIDNETKGMYHFNGKNLSGDKKWSGWVPKKSCIMEKINYE